MPDYTHYSDDRQGVTSAALRTLAGSFASIPLTLFGLILVTFLIGRVMPIDPVIAIAGDHAPPDVIAASAGTRTRPAVAVQFGSIWSTWCTAISAAR